MPYLKLPDGEFIEVKQGMSYADAVAAAKERFPKLYAKTNEAEEGFVPSVRSGLEGLKSNLSTAVAPLFGTSEEAIRRQAAKSEAKQSEIAKAPSWEDVKAAQEKYGLFGGEKPEERGSVSSALGMMRGQLGESIPQMATVAGGARLGAMAGTAVAPGIGTLIGGGLGAVAAGIPAFTGSGVQRQISEQEKAGVEKPLDYGAALTSAVPSAILDAAETFFVLGRLGMGRALTNALPKLAEKFGLKEAEATLVKTAERSLAATVGRGAAKGVVVEMPTEIAQGVLERAQAGLSLTDADARKEYESIAAGTVGPGAVFGGAGNLSARSVARERVADIKNERDTQQLEASKIAQQAQDEQDAIAAAQGAKAAEQAQFRAQPKGTQLDMFGAEDTSPDQAMYPRPQRAFDIPEAPVQETPDLAKQYVEAKQAADQSANAMEAAHKANDNTAYSAARDTYDAASKQVNGLEATAAQQGVVLPVDVNALPRLIEGATSAVQKTESKISKAREEGKDIKPLVAELEKQKSKLAQYKEQQNPVQGNLLDFNRLDAADAADIESKYVAEQPGGETTIDAMSVAQDEYSEQMAEQQRAKAREAAVREREQRFKDAEIKQASEKGQQLVDNASIESILVGQGKSLEETTNRRNQISALQEAMDSGTVNAEVQKLLGIVVPNNVAFDLTNLDPNAVGVKAIQTRREELELQRKTEFPNKKLVKDGALTKAGKKLIGIEATINELKRLEIIAKDHTLTGAESRLLGAASSSKEPALQKQQARFRADFAAKRRDRALFDFSNIIDSLRKGEFTGSTRNGLLRQAKALRRMVVNSTIKEAGWRRVEFDRPALTDAEKISIKKTITTRLDTLAAKAEPTAKQSPTALSQSYSAAVERKLLAARAKGVSEIEYLTLDKELRKRQGSIERGMTISPNKNAVPEYKKLQREVSLLAYKAAFPSKGEGKKSVVKTEYTLGKQFPVKTEAAVEAAPTKDTATLDLFEEADKADKVAAASKIVKGFTAQWNMARGQHRTAVGKMNTIFARFFPEVEKANNKIREIRKEANALRAKLKNKNNENYVEDKTERKKLFKEYKGLAKSIEDLQDQVRNRITELNTALGPQQDMVRKAAGRLEVLAAKEKTAKDALKETKEERPPLTTKELGISNAEGKNAWLTIAKALGYENETKVATEAAEKTPLEAIKETLAPRIIGTRTVETEIVPVKGAIAGTELGDIQKRLDAIAEVIHKYGARLGLDAKASMETRSTPANLSAAQQRINNNRLGWLEARDTLRQRMVMRVPKIVTPKVKTKATNLEAAADEAAKVIPREYAIATAALKDVSKLLNKPKRSINAMHEAHLDQLTLEKGKLKAEKQRPTLDKLEREFLVTRIATIQKLVDETDFDALTDKAAALVARISDLKTRAAKYDVDLSLRVLPHVTAAAQVKAMKETLAAEGRKAPIRSGPLSTGSPEQIAAKKEKVRVGLRQDRATLDEMEISQAARDAAADFIDHRDLDNTDRRDATDADVGVDLRAAQDIASRVQKALPKGVTFVYAPTLNDAPPQFHAALARAGKTRAKGAVMPDGTVVVIGEAHKNTADLEATISHELIGHYGVDGILGKDGVQNLTNKLFAKGNQHVAEVATGLGVFPDVETALASSSILGDDVKTSIVREMIAHAAEGMRVAPKFADKVKVFIKDMIAAVRNWMRSVGMSDAAKKDTKEIQALIRESSRAFVEGTVGVYVSPTGEAVFRDGHNTKPGWMSEESWTAQEKIIAKDRPLVDQLKGNLLGLAGVTQFVDGTAPFVAALNKGVAKGLISDLDATQARYNISAHAKRMNFTRAVATEGALTLVKKQDKGRDFWMVESGKGADKATLVKVFKALGKAGMSEQQAGRSFTMYLAALRTKNEGIGVEALNFGKDASGNPILTEKMLRTFEQEVNANPKVKANFEEARGIYNEYNRGLIDFAVQTGKFSKELGEKLKAKKDFIPFYRQIGGEIKLFIGDEKSPITIGTLKDQPYLHELVGGDTAILDIFTSAVQNTHMLTDMALRNLATKNVAQTLYKMGMLKTAVSRDERKKEADTGVKAKTYAIRKGKGPASPDVLRFQDNGEDMHVVVKTEDTVFSDIPVELLVKGLEGVKTTFPAALELLGMPAKFLRRAVVLSPLYPVRQILRDSFSVLGTSGANFMPVITPLKNVYSALAGTNKTADTLEKQGLIGGQLLAGEGMEGMSTILRGVTSGKVTVSSMLAWAEAKSMQADAGVRVAAYNSFRKQGLNEIEAWVQSNELMDFNKRGISPSVYFANTLIPFFSAQIQGLNVFAKAMTGRMPYNERLKIKEKFYKRGMTMAALTLMYAAAMEDDDAYKNATPQQKYNNFFVRVPFFDEPLKIPIAFEYGLMFKAIPEAIFNTAFGKEEFAPVAKTIVQMAWNSVPGLTPQAAKPFIEAVTGKDLFTSADIESAKELKLDPNQRYREDTTALGQMLGSIGIPGMSPVKVDHFIKSVGSQSLLSVVSLADVFLAGPKPPSAEMKTSKIPLIGGAFQPTDAGAIINRTYELMQEAEQAKNTYTKLITDGKDKEADAYLNANIARIGMGDSVAGFRNTMGEITKYEASVKTDKNMAPSEKRKVLDSARLLKIQVAKEYRDAFRSVPFRSGA